MLVIGYKGFNSDFTNRYGDKFEVGKVYDAGEEIKWGNQGNGFHLCTHIEDCFRYVDSETSIMTEVIGFGNVQKYDDSYYGYFDMYVVQYLKIIRVISRKEIIEIAKTLPDNRLERFIQTYELNDDETDEIMETSYGKTKVLKALQYYHFGDKGVYRRNLDG